jgi:uncharacterized protein YegJ (DUF2314 family)
MIKTIIQMMLCCIISLHGADNNPPIVNVDDTDKEMNLAIEKAKQTFIHFEKNWKTLKNNGYSIKVAMKTKDNGVEHIWFNPIEINGDKIKAKCANEPGNIDGLKLGDIRTISKTDISDWMIVVGNKCYGGYTIRVLAKMDPANAPPFEFADF